MWVWFRMDMILKKVEEMMKEKKMEVSKFPPCEELQISLLRWAGGRGRKEGGREGEEGRREGEEGRREGEGKRGLLYTYTCDIY